MGVEALPVGGFFADEAEAELWLEGVVEPGVVEEDAAVELVACYGLVV